MVQYKFNQPYYKLHFSELSDGTLHVLSFEGEESISRLFEYRFELISKEADINPDDILNKAATFELTRGAEPSINIHGIISHFEQHGKSPDYVFYHAVLVPKLWRLTLNYQSMIFQHMDIERVVTAVLEQAGLSGDDFRFELSGSYPEMEYVVQYRETDFNFISRRLEHFGIFYYFDHSGESDVVVFTDNNDALPAIDQDEDIFYNPSFQQLTPKETISNLVFSQKVVTGLVKLKDYNYRFPNTALLVENQIDTEAPGVYYDFGDHFKDLSEGEMLAKIRNEEIICGSKIFRGKSDCRLFRAGYIFKMGNHYRADWNSEYIITKLKSRGNQRSLFAFLSVPKGKAKTYENEFEAIPPEHAYRPPRITPIPQLPGIMTARMESGSNDEYAFLDDKGRYKVKMPFDLSDKTNGEASRQIRLSQPYTGPGYGIHFPNHADTEMVWSCIDGNVDRPLGLGTVPNPSNTSPATSANKQQSVIRTAAQNELTFDDTTGSENIYLHGTKNWTIDIVNDKNQTIGHDETASVGNDRSRDVGNDENITIGNNQAISVGANRDKTVGSNQSETVGGDKSINVAGNHDEMIGGNMSQTVARNKTETIAIGKSTTIGAGYQISVGAAMNESVGAVKAEEIGASKNVVVAVNSTEDVGTDKSVQAGGNISEKAGKNFTMQAGEKMVLSSGDDFAISGGKKGAVDMKDQLTLSCGKASITLKKNGDIIIKGKNINVKGSGNIVMKSKKILEN